jgi:hypothetical protein
LRNDFWNVKIYPTLKERLEEEPDKKKGNYLIMTDKSAVLTLNHFKTDYTFGQQQITFPIELRKVIKASLKKYPRPYLLWNFCDKTPYSSSKSASASILKQLKEIFDGKQMTICLLRHSYVSSPEVKALNTYDRQLLARRMLHSLTTNISYMKKYGGDEMSEEAKE